MTVYFSLEDLLLLPAAIAYTIWWAHDLRNGSRVRAWTLTLHIMVYGLAAFYVWAVSLGEVGVAGVTSSPLAWLWTIVLTTAVVVATELGLRFGSSHVVVERSRSGAWQVRAPVSIALFWLSLFLIRFILEDSLLGGFSVFFPSGPAPSGVPVSTFVAVVLVVASMYLLSFGFILGISWSVRERHHQGLRSVSSPSPDAAEFPSAAFVSAEPTPSPPVTTGPAYTVPQSLVLVSPISPTATSVAAAYPGFSAFAPNTATNSPPSTAAAPHGTPAAGVHCSKCGSDTMGIDRFCGNCGNPLFESPGVPPPTGDLAVMTPEWGGSAVQGPTGSVAFLGGPSVPVGPGALHGAAPETTVHVPSGTGATRAAEAYCPLCDQPISPGDRYCGNCGRAVIASATHPAGQAAAPVGRPESGTERPA